MPFQHPFSAKELKTSNDGGGRRVRAKLSADNCSPSRDGSGSASRGNNNSTSRGNNSILSRDTSNLSRDNSIMSRQRVVSVLRTKRLAYADHAAAVTDELKRKQAKK